jgi:glycerophosphoryl diester phosphodiesterase
MVFVSRVVGSCVMLSRALCCGVAAAMTASVSPALAGQTVWDFDPDATPLSASVGTGVLTYRGNTASAVSFGRISTAGLPPMLGGDSGVMLVGALSAAQGINMDHASPPNGVHTVNGWTSNYTIVMDVLIPGASFASVRSLFQTNTSNGNDGDYFIDGQGRIGTSGVYNGQLQPGVWHRIAIVVGAADNEGMASTYIDGVFVGGQGGTGASIGSRWALYSQAGADLIMFADDNGETAPIWVSSMSFTDRRMTAAEIAALGGAHAAGVRTPGAATNPPRNYTRCAGPVAHRGASAAAPENTLAAIDAAIAMGAWAFEMDVRLSSDGVAVLMHDGTMERTTNLVGNATSFTAAQMQGADAGSWFDPAFASERVPTLRQAFERMRGTGVVPYLDVKVSGMGPAIRTALQQAGMTDREIWLWAYNRGLVAEFNATFANPRIVVGEIPRTAAQFADLRGLTVVGLDLGFGSYTGGEVNAAWVAQARAEGFFTCGYTVVTPTVMNTMIDLGVDFIETDCPDMVARAGRAPLVLELTDRQVRQGETVTLAATAEPGAVVVWRRDGEVLAGGPTPWGSLIELGRR